MANPMTLHREPAAFGDAVSAAAGTLGISETLVEKDYWVTWVLRNLAASPYADRVVFKGGTSLSKAYRLVERFSEDVDLAVIREAGMTDSAVRRLLGQVHHAAADDLPEVAELGRKWTKNRVVYHRYPQVFSAAIPVATEHLLLEITAFGQPHPYQRLPLISYVGEQLLAAGYADAVAEYGLVAFEFNVLSLGRTFAEKVMALVRASYEDNPAGELGRKVRHLYDMHHLIKHPDVGSMDDTGLFELLAAVQVDDADAGVTGPTRDWKTKPLANCWAFGDNAANMAQLRRAYEQDLPGLLHRPAPAFALVLETMQQLATRLQVYDARANQQAQS
jgi:Nucleotidyl transferase AbiEii toxin, Type IV TA system